ncbi:MAG: hypothetical protein N3D16_02580 [Anaerolineales bacterium]|nr:hypothetical protein [Anaerolineales bacterium]
MHVIQTFVIRLFIEPGELVPLKGILHNVREDADYPFGSEEDLVVLLHQLTRRVQKEASHKQFSLREETEGNE